MTMEFVASGRMRRGRRFRVLLVIVVLYFVCCTIGGIYLADASLHPGRRALTPEDVAMFQSMLRSVHADLRDVAITTSDQFVLRGWLLRPTRPNGDAVVVLHGLGDNRMGMTGYAQILLVHGYTVLLPDARAQGVSGGSLATFGLLEADDIHRWVDFLSAEVHPECVYGMGESMGASQLLQSLRTESRYCAVVAESPFSTFREIAYDRMGQPFQLGPWVGRTLLRPLVEIAFLRARWKYGLRMGEISPEDALAKSHVPVLLIHGQVDSNIPVRHSRAIHALVPRTVLSEVPGADHCGALGMAPEEFENRVVRWMNRSAVGQIQ
jgi:pimeloyl-ACP methyl ester carboxylesterase